MTNRIALYSHTKVVINLATFFISLIINNLILNIIFNDNYFKNKCNFIIIFKDNYYI